MPQYVFDIREYVELFSKATSYLEILDIFKSLQAMQENGAITRVERLEAESFGYESLQNILGKIQG